MTTYNINPEHVERIATQIMRELGQGQFDKVEIVMGIFEAAGRIAVDTSHSPMEGREYLDVGLMHLRNTMEAGFRAKGFEVP